MDRCLQMRPVDRALSLQQVLAPVAAAAQARACAASAEAAAALKP